MHQAVRRHTAASLLLLLAAAGTACSTGVGRFLVRPTPLDEAQQKYTRMIRWGEFQRAGDYVDPELRDAFLHAVQGLTALRITDYEIDRIEQADEESAVAHVTYTAYSRASLIELEPLAEVQEWYRDSETREWRVRPDLTRLAAVAERLEN